MKRQLKRNSDGTTYNNVLPVLSTHVRLAYVMMPEVRKKLRVTLRTMERYILGKARSDRIRQITGFNNIAKSVMKRMW